MKLTPSDCRICKDGSCAVMQLNNEELDTYSQNIVQVGYDKGESLFKQNTPNTYIVYIRKGLVKVHVHTEGEKDFILKLVKAPAFIGLPTVFGHCVNQYSATAIEPTDACCINIESFKTLLRQNGRFAYEIIADLSKDELCNFQSFVNMVQKQVPGRLAGTLLYFSEHIYHSDEFELPLNRIELAELIGTSRESATRNLQELKKSGIIEIDRSKIRIVKPDRLKVIHDAG
jgi:CRP-like cAMP-binding protein